MKGLAVVHVSLLLLNGVTAFVPSSYRKMASLSAPASSASTGQRASFSKSTTRLFVGTQLDFHQTLGVSWDASMQEIKSAYRKLAKKWHPDSNPGNDTTEKFQQINEAYSILTNPELKRKMERDAMFNDFGGRSYSSADYSSYAPSETVGSYNRHRASAPNPFRNGFGRPSDRERGFGAPFGGGGYQYPSDRATSTGSPYMSYDDVWDNGEDFGYEEGPPDYGFDPFFRSSRGREAPADFVDRDAPRRGPNMRMNDSYRPGRTSQSGPPPPHRGGVEIGADLRLDVTIDFKTAVLGGEKTVRMRHMETCGTCQGQGVKPGTKVPCSECHGEGHTADTTRTPFGPRQDEHVCSSCRGKGFSFTKGCRTCLGNRVVEKSKDIKVSIPPGVKNGNRLCIAGEGDVGPDGGPAGDLYIFLQVEDDPQFRVEGSDIYSEATISFADAILGAAITTPVVDGDVIVTVPPGTQPGFILRLKGKGATILGQSGKRGDHYVIMNIEIPSDLSLEDTKLVETLRENRMSKLKP